MAITDERIQELIEGTCPKAATTGYYADLLSALRELLALRDAAQPNFTCQSCGAMFCVKVPSQLTAEQFLEGVPRCSRCVEVEQLSGELLALREQNRWIPVTEKLPEKHHEVLVAVTPDNGRRFSMRAHQRNGDWFDFGEDGEWSLGGYGWTVTHWMEDRPLPAPPLEGLIFA